jgi:hypothetical protein
MKIFAVVLLTALTGCSRIVERVTAPDLTCNVIHEPTTGCPSGYVKELKPRFLEKNGVKEFACVSTDVQKETCTDVLKAGESETIYLSPPDVDVDSPTLPKGKT